MQAGGREFESLYLHLNLVISSKLYIENCIENKIEHYRITTKVVTSKKFRHPYIEIYTSQEINLIDVTLYIVKNDNFKSFESGQAIKSVGWMPGH